jgi:cytochrome bd-type quinol oxidase subunit 2
MVEKKLGDAVPQGEKQAASQPRRASDTHLGSKTLPQKSGDQPAHRHPHVLNASTNLLAICFVIIGGLKLTDLNAKSYSDETAWVAAALLFTSTACSYLAIRNNDAKEWQSYLADWAFLGGLCSLMLSVLMAAIFL